MRTASRFLEIPETLSGESRMHWNVPANDCAVCALPVTQTAQPAAMGKAVRLVSFLAFGHALAFLAFWLLTCVSAGAAPEFDMRLQLSTYAPTKTRDPIARVGGAAVEGKVGAVGFMLEGILYQASHPTAIVNGQLVTLNKTVTINAGSAPIQVRALEIGRDKVVLEAAGQKVELFLTQQPPPATP